MIRIPERSIKATQLAKKLSDTTAFEAIDSEWYSTKVSGWSKSYADYVKRAFKNNVFPYPGSQLVNEIKPLELLSVLQRMEKRGAPELTSKVSSIVVRFFATRLLQVVPNTTLLLILVE